VAAPSMGLWAAPADLILAPVVTVTAMPEPSPQLFSQWPGQNILSGVPVRQTGRSFLFRRSVPAEAAQLPSCRPVARRPAFRKGYTPRPDTPHFPRGS